MGIVSVSVVVVRAAVDAGLGAAAALSLRVAK
jgi:hypothetical protein